MIKFKDYYIKCAEEMLLEQLPDGAMPSGCNGLYNDPETAMRSTSHYLILFTRAGELTGNEKFFNAAKCCLNYLLYSNNLREKYTHKHRIKEGKDKCNGLIGTAWVIEALVYAWQFYYSIEAKNLAIELFNLHPFDETHKVWKRVEPDGMVLTFDATFNHQLWFAACSAKLAGEDPLIEKKINLFLEGTRVNLALTKKGRIIHPLWTFKKAKKELIKRFLMKSYRNEFKIKEVGYHAFNLYAFSLLIRSNFKLPSHLEYKVNKAVNYLNSKEFNLIIKESKYGYPYNPPGWEVPVSLLNLSDSDVLTCKKWLSSQIAFYGKNIELVNDPITAKARLYEVALLPDEVFELEIKGSSFDF